MAAPHTPFFLTPSASTRKPKTLPPLPDKVKTAAQAKLEAAGSAVKQKAKGDKPLEKQQTAAALEAEQAAPFTIIFDLCSTPAIETGASASPRPSSAQPSSPYLVLGDVKVGKGSLALNNATKPVVHPKNPSPVPNLGKWQLEKLQREFQALSARVERVTFSGPPCKRETGKNIRPTKISSVSTTLSAARADASSNAAVSPLRKFGLSNNSQPLPPLTEELGTSSNPNPEPPSLSSNSF